MKIKKEMAIDDLYFGIKLYPLSYTKGQRQELQTYNLFGFSRVRYAVAAWVIMPEEEKARKKDLHDQLMWCFGDVWCRAEYEFIVNPWPGGEDDESIKADAFTMYVEPNGELLMDLVNRVSASSARAYIRAHNEHRRKHYTMETKNYYEEPKEFYVVDLDGEILPSGFEDKTIEKSKELGNYFDTREEAELAVRKLRAFKRLKDKGFRFTGWEDLGAKLDMEDLMISNREVIDTNNVIGFRIDDYRACIKDLDICFGGEE